MPDCVVDGEAVVWSDGWLHSHSLQRPLTSRSRALPSVVREHPASFATFDVLAVAGHDTRHLKLRDRRSLLEELARTWSPPLALSPVRKHWWPAYPSTVSCE